MKSVALLILASVLNIKAYAYSPFFMDVQTTVLQCSNGNVNVSLYEHPNMKDAQLVVQVANPQAANNNYYNGLVRPMLQNQPEQLFMNGEASLRVAYDKSNRYTALLSFRAAPNALSHLVYCELKNATGPNALHLVK